MNALKRLSHRLSVFLAYRVLVVYTLTFAVAIPVILLLRWESALRDFLADVWDDIETQYFGLLFHLAKAEWRNYKAARA